MAPPVSIGVARRLLPLFLASVALFSHQRPGPLIRAAESAGLPPSPYEREWAQYRGADGLLSLDYLKASHTSHSDGLRGRKALDQIFKVVFCSPNPGPAAPPNINLLKNPRFQEGLSAWQAFGDSSLRRAQAANYSYGVSYARREEYAGPAQMIRNLPAAAYELAIWVKLGAGGAPAGGPAGGGISGGIFGRSVGKISASSAAGGSVVASAGGRQYVNAMAKIDGKYVCIGGANARSSCWTKLIGGFTLHRTAAEVAVYIQGATVGTEIWVTSASLIEVNKKMWRQRQNDNIRKYRQRDVTLRLHGTGAMSARVQIDQVTSGFPFGANVNGAILYDRNYQRWFLSRFNWAVFNNEAKWYFNEQSPGVVNYNVTDALVEWFTRRNVKVRAHNVFWAVEKFVQTWVKDLNNTALWKAMQRRMNSAVQRYRGKVQHWDVLNEPMHGNYYGGRLGGNVHAWMFKAARALDPNVRLFLNEYNTVEQCDKEANPERYLEKVWNLTSSGAPVTGIGVEAHYSGEPQLVRLKHDLNKLAVAGMPIWLTELDFNEVQSERQRADYLEAVMREAFAHPSVAGMVLWSAGRSTCAYYKDMDPGMCSTCDACLADAKFVDNLAGTRYVRLRKEWSTHLIRQVTFGSPVKFRGFHGKYRARITVNGRLIERYFYVPKQTTGLNVDIRI
ncbi:hypothetical protein CLOM_g4629 [Closterium sp. NIES-68]|nr:hypothetical protein CLOM_g4629 [Closterium sp. NIES-68]GJP85754.1 hypothetical protein CLOP_g15853 [Closterium sp. NIES-67]